MIDLRPATDRVARVVAGVTDDQLDDPTPCADMSVRVLLHHLLALTIAFRDAAGKVEGPTTSTPPAPSAEALPNGWRDRLTAQLGELAQAWADEQAWQGMTMAGGVELPGEVAGLVALNEVQMHGWDLARATRQPYEVADELAEAVLPLVTPTGDDSDREGLFGPPVEVPDDAPVFDRVLGFGGRDPDWTGLSEH